MNQWGMFERSMDAAARRDMEKELYVCDNCSFTYFELISLKQFVRNAPVVPGQDPVPFEVEGFPVLKCGKCGTLKEHQVSVMNPSDRVTKEYYRIVEFLQPKPDQPPIVQERTEEVKDEDTDKGQE